ncbi:MAG: VOC family protein [Chloroflexi bacterium]|nr:VOC family protein [Chloroflexota bacterium]
MRIELTSIHVDDQDKALAFYTDILGFVKKEDFPVGEFKWLTVVSPDAPDGAQLLLEPNDNPAAQAYQQAIFEQGIPHAAFAVDNIQAEYERLEALGVVFSMKPIDAAGGAQALFDDTCGNRILLYELLEGA